MMEKLHKRIEQAVEDLITKKGFEVPIYVAAIAANGSTLVVHFRWIDQEHREKGIDADIVADYFVEDTFPIPINFMFVDGTGERAAQLMASKQGPPGLHLVS